MNSTKVVMLNLLAARAGGQLTRANALLTRIRQYDPTSRIIVLQRAGAREFADYSALNMEVVSVRFPLRQFMALQRMLWENLFLPGVLSRMGVDTYINFAHYLPVAFPAHVQSVVAVTNLAPFSAEAFSVERAVTRLKMRLQKAAILTSIKRASNIIALSEACKSALVSRGVRRDSIAVIPNGVDQQLCRLQGSMGVLRENAVDRPYVLYVSHFHRYKNHGLLVEAFAALPGDLKAQYQLVLVGGIFDKAYFREVQEHIGRHAVSASVVVIPGLPPVDLSVLYANATLFVFPSLIENCPNILLEAMCFGLPVLSSALPPMPEFCEGAAVLFDPFSQRDLEDKLALHLVDASARSALARKARARSQIYSWDLFTDKITGLYLSRG